ncbi:centromere protein P [Poecilia reticulata]|uniref:centromere protein P n=1 Tax=Poecilia reticulata TaxID=8081 RepID=UPI0004A42F0C|nr:PREDICTED: centromere protein P [Poecilia reticulata]XP_017160196.1 PREDICTED: centromere protein P [Poecilia reticulata]
MSEENAEELKQLEAEVKLLQAEIIALQQQRQDSWENASFQFRGQMQDALAFVCGRTQDLEETVVSRLKEEVEELEKDLKLQTQINGICLNSCITKTLQSRGQEVVHQVRLSGRSSELVFQVEFQLSELKDGSRTERRIRDLNLVLDSSDLLSLSSFLSRVEETRDLLLFFRTIRSYSEKCDDRTRTFQHFQEKFPSIVSLPKGMTFGMPSEVMTLNHPELPGCCFFIHWCVDVSTGGAVTPKIQLLSKIPEKALQLFPSQPAGGGAAEAFQSLLRILGPEAAIESIIRAVSLSESDKLSD